MTFAGVKMSQTWNDLAIWETFFNEHPIRTLIELGTDNGGMSLFFAVQCHQRDIEFHTFDNQKWIDFDRGLPALFGLGLKFHHVDLFSERGIAWVSDLIKKSPGEVAVFFDDGDKPREWQMFAHLTRPGDYCIVHDWGTEFFEKDLLDVPVERILTDLCDARPDGWKARWFKRV